MKKYKYIAGIVLGMVAVVLCSCNDLLDGKDNPYEGTTRELTVRLVYPEGHPDREGGSARVTLEDVDRGTVYTASAGNDDMARFEVLSEFTGSARATGCRSRMRSSISTARAIR